MTSRNLVGITIECPSGRFLRVASQNAAPRPTDGWTLTVRLTPQSGVGSSAK